MILDKIAKTIDSFAKCVVWLLLWSKCNIIELYMNEKEVLVQPA